MCLTWRISLVKKFKCRDYYHLRIKEKYERPNKWAKFREKFNPEDKQLSEASVMPLRVSKNLIYVLFSIKY